MKRILIGFGICMIVVQLLSACVREQVVERSYELVNSTNHNIKISFYNKNKFIRIVELGKQEEKWQIFYEKKMASGVEPYWVFESDSVIVVFNDKKVNSFTIKNSDRRNFLFNDAYTIEKKDLYRFSFIEEDFEKAAEK